MAPTKIDLHAQRCCVQTVWRSFARRVCRASVALLCVPCLVVVHRSHALDRIGHHDEVERIFDVVVHPRLVPSTVRPGAVRELLHAARVPTPRPHRVKIVPVQDVVHALARRMQGHTSVVPRRRPQPTLLGQPLEHGCHRRGSDLVRFDENGAQLAWPLRRLTGLRRRSGYGRCARASSTALNRIPVHWFASSLGALAGRAVAGERRHAHAVRCRCRLESVGRLRGAHCCGSAKRSTRRGRGGNQC